MSARPLRELVHPSWAQALAPVESVVAGLGEFLRAEVAAGRGYLPAGPHVLRAFAQPLDQVRVLIVGQDPYPTPGHAVGLSFAVPPGTVPLPPSLVNIGTELRDDLGCDLPDDLAAWSAAGVLLLNRVLTVRPGTPASHRGRGWEEVTDAAVDALAAPVELAGCGKGARDRRPGQRQVDIAELFGDAVGAVLVIQLAVLDPDFRE